MKKTVKTGGMGKSPAIEKMNQLDALDSRIQAANELEKKAFEKNAKAGARNQKIEEFHISF